MAIRVGICGVGSFATCFIPLFKHHPDVESLVLCDLDSQKLTARCEEFGISDRSPSLDDLCDLDLDISMHNLSFRIGCCSLVPLWWVR